MWEGNRMVQVFLNSENKVEVQKDIFIYFEGAKL